MEALKPCPFCSVQDAHFQSDYGALAQSARLRSLCPVASASLVELHQRALPMTEQPAKAEAGSVLIDTPAQS